MSVRRATEEDIEKALKGDHSALGIVIKDLYYTREVEASLRKYIEEAKDTLEFANSFPSERT
jgi:hypothetical protein